MAERSIGRRSLVKAAVVLVSLAGAAPLAGAQTAPPPATAWKQLFQNNQAVYYVDTSAVQQSGQSLVTSLLEYKVPQVINGAQVWSIISHMKVSCDQKQIITDDNTLYALKMGAGPVVATQPTDDTWHQPQPASLGALVWNAACGRS